MKYSKWIVILVILLNVLFTPVVLWLFYVHGNEPATLIVSWFSFTGIELLALAGIKISEVRKEDATEVPEKQKKGNKSK